MSSIKQKLIENIFYSVKKERISFQRQKLFKELAGFVVANSTQTNISNHKKRLPNKKIVRCKYYYKLCRIDLTCPDKSQKQSPSLRI